MAMKEFGYLEGGGLEVKFQFNPAQLELARSNSWVNRKILNREVPKRDYTGGSGWGTDLVLLFDEGKIRQAGLLADDEAYFVEAMFSNLEYMTREDPATRTPPVCLFSYAEKTFECVITGYKERSELRNSNADIIRGRVTITIVEYRSQEFHRTIREEKGEQFITIPPTLHPYNGVTFRDLAHMLWNDANLAEAIIDYNPEIVLFNDGIIIEPGTEVRIPPWIFVSRYLEKPRLAGLLAVS